MWYSQSYGAAGEDFDTTRKAGWVAASLQADPIPGVVLAEPELLSTAQIAQVHSAAYVNAIASGQPRSLAQSNGFSWDPGLWTAVQASTSGMVAAALHALQTGEHTGTLSSGLHHAQRDTGMGFCTFNGLALAARAAIDAGAKRVLILDLDAHCGGGTFSLVRDWPEVWGLDVSVSGFDDYTPEPNGRFTLDVVTDAEVYLRTVADRIDNLSTEDLDLVLFNAGVDPHEASGGLAGITASTLVDRDDMVFEWASAWRIPVAFCLAGGYTGSRLSPDELVDLHRITVKAAAHERGRYLGGVEEPLCVSMGVLSSTELAVLDHRDAQNLADMVASMVGRLGASWFANAENRLGFREDLRFFFGYPGL